MLNSVQIEATVAAPEQLMVGLAAGSVSRAQLVFWLRTHVVARSSYRCLLPNKALQLTGKGRTCGDPAFVWHQPLALRSNTMAALAGS